MNDGSQKTCTVEGCERELRYRRYCSTHQARWQKYGQIELPPVYCDNCSALVSDSGRQQKTLCFLCKEDKGKCRYPTCTNRLNHKTGNKWCHSHARKLLRVRWRKVAPKCRIPECPNFAKYGGGVEQLCEGHSSQVRRYGAVRQGPLQQRRANPVTPSNRDRIVADLMDRQNYRCAICRKSGVQEWHLDHDHGCCPLGSYPCMDCVRGVLCRTCNLGLGMFQESAEVVDAALSYLRRSTGQLDAPTLFAVQ